MKGSGTRQGRGSDIASRPDQRPARDAPPLRRTREGPPPELGDGGPAGHWGPAFLARPVLVGGQFLQLLPQFLKLLPKLLELRLELRFLVL